MPRYHIKKQLPDKVVARGFLARRSTSRLLDKLFVDVQVCFFGGLDVSWNMGIDNFIVKPRHSFDWLIADDSVLRFSHVLDDTGADCLINYH
ncbi:MAG: hypothetical protein KJP10_04110 [Gammaproteobacteria bacterium]|nr:hypothetical protein [Gammaproteobacteria bacterium]